ncbi:MAG: XRE family transcriptional regulator [Desulfovibrionaceae bacterium]
MSSTRRPGVRVQCGVARFKARRRIEEVLDKHGLNHVGLAKRLGVSQQAVSATIGGTRHSPVVLDGLRNLGVPERYLYDPRLVKPEQLVA